MIVRNEATTLERCLLSVCNAVDEIIVVDTGSEDSTKEIAAKYTDRIYDFPWRKNFSEARQFAFNHALGKWLIWLDADDVVINANNIRTAIQSASEEIKVFYWKYIYRQDEYGNSICELWRERCVLNDGSFQWVGKVHEVLVSSCSAAVAYNEEIVVLHQQDSHKIKDIYRNIEILIEDYERTKSNPDVRLLLYLGLEYARLENYNLAVIFLTRYIHSSEWKDQKYLVQLKIADIFRYQLKYKNALGIAFESVKIHPQWPLAYFSLAETYYFLKDWNKTIHWIEYGRTLPIPKTICIINPLDYQFRWIIYYTNALFHNQRICEALDWTERALKICPHDPWHLANREIFIKILS